MSEMGNVESDSLGKLPPEIKETGLMVKELPVYQVDPDFPFQVGFATLGINGETGESKTIPEGRSGYSVGANPCISGLMIGKEGEILLFHSFGERLSKKQKTLIKWSTVGLVGGEQKLLTRYRRLFERKGYLILKSDDPRADFNLLIVRQKGLKIPVGGKIIALPEGIFYGYGRVGTAR